MDISSRNQETSQQMSYFLISKQWRERMIYAVMSAFVGWHTLAITVGPAPDNTIKQFLRPLIDPYLEILFINNGWGFFAPVGMSSQFRYTVEDAAGKRHTFVPTKGLRWYHPNNFAIRGRYTMIVESPETYGDSAAALFCRQHASLQPVAITLLDVVQEKEFLPSDHIAGKNPLDSDFARVNVLKSYRCSKR